MHGRPWSFLLDRGPVQRAVRDEVCRAVDRELGRAEMVLRSYRVALVQSEERTGQLRRRVVELEAVTGTLREALTARQPATEKLRRALAAEQASTERWRSACEAAERRVRERRAAEAELDEQATTDLFRCLE